MSPVGHSSGSWRPTKIAPSAVAAMPPILRRVWDEYQGRCAQVDQAKADAAAALRDAQAAPAYDRAMAAQAVAADTDLPDATAPALVKVSDMARRRHEATITLAAQAEERFLEAARYNRGAWHDALTARAQEYRDDAAATLDTLTAQGRALAEALSARRVAASDQALGRPMGQGTEPIHVQVGGQSIPWDRLCTAIAQALEEAAPATLDAVQAANADRVAALAAQRAKYPGGVLPPGVVPVLA